MSWFSTIVHKVFGDPGAQRIQDAAAAAAGNAIQHTADGIINRVNPPKTVTEQASTLWDQLTSSPLGIGLLIVVAYLVLRKK